MSQTVTQAIKLAGYDLMDAAAPYVCQHLLKPGPT